MCKELEVREFEVEFPIIFAGFGCFICHLNVFMLWHHICNVVLNLFSEKFKKRKNRNKEMFWNHLYISLFFGGQSFMLSYLSYLVLAAALSGSKYTILGTFDCFAISMKAALVAPSRILLELMSFSIWSSLLTDLLNFYCSMSSFLADLFKEKLFFAIFFVFVWIL